MFIDTEGRERSLICNKSHPKINLSPKWTNSWFDTPVATPPDTIGFWPATTKFPLCGSDANKVPNDYKNKVPLKFLFEYQSQEIKLSVRKKIHRQK